VKLQLIVCVLVASAGTLLADDTPFPATVGPAMVDPAVMGTPAPYIPGPMEQSVDGMVTATAFAPGAEASTAAPVVVGPDGMPAASQYQPPLMAQPGPGGPGCASCGQASPYAVPGYPAPIMAAPPGGVIAPTCGNPFTYPSLTPDVTMVPTTPQGPLPARPGWVQQYQFGGMPFSEAKNGWGHFGEETFDLNWKYIAPLYPAPLIFSFEQQYDLRLLNGPSSPPGIPNTNLPGSLHRIGWDFELKTAFAEPWNAVVGFNPSIDSDFQQSLSKHAFDWDGRAAFLYTPQPDLTFVIGFMEWDRISARFLPWAGMIYRPNPYWQFDLVFPQFRVATFLWDEWGFKTMLYGRIEYHTEAYEIYNPVLGERDQVSFSDWRALLGVNKDRGTFDYFFEGGWIFHRDVDYRVAPQGFEVSSGVIVQGGMRF
jgi:hypothetical protein